MEINGGLQLTTVLVEGKAFLIYVYPKHQIWSIEEWISISTKDLFSHLFIFDTTGVKPTQAPCIHGGPCAWWGEGPSDWPFSKIRPSWWRDVTYYTVYTLLRSNSDWHVAGGKTEQRERRETRTRTLDSGDSRLPNVNVSEEAFIIGFYIWFIDLNLKSKSTIHNI